MSSPTRRSCCVVDSSCPKYYVFQEFFYGWSFVLIKGVVERVGEEKGSIPTVTTSGGNGQRQTRRFPTRASFNGVSGQSNVMDVGVLIANIRVRLHKATLMMMLKLRSGTFGGGSLFEESLDNISM